MSLIERKSIMKKTLPFIEKYESQNPISRYLISRFFESLSFLVRRIAPRTILEVGCGEGFLALELARQGYMVHGLDVREQAIAFAICRARKMWLEEQLRFDLGDVYTFPAEKFKEELLICCEVLEHLENPEKALDCILKFPADYAIFSVPREPLWRFLNLCRFKYLSKLGNTPGHVNHWSKKGFLSFLEKRYSVVEILSPTPWTMVLCKKA